MKLRAWPLLSVSLAAHRLQRRIRKRSGGAAGLRVAPATPRPRRSQTPPAAACWCSGPKRVPASTSERIALLRSEQRFDFYAASRWAAPAPDVIESVMIDTLRATGAFSAVFDDYGAVRAALQPALHAAPLRSGLHRRVAAHPPSSSRSTARSAATAIASCSRASRLQGRRRPREDRLNAVVAAFESATAAAMTELGRATSAALASEKPPSEGR